jgi:hypothetical protein
VSSSVLLRLLFIATSNGEQPELKTRKVSGKDGSCEKHHMKLHIYVCVQSKGKDIYIIHYSESIEIRVRNSANYIVASNIIYTCKNLTPYIAGLPCNGLCSHCLSRVANKPHETILVRLCIDLDQVRLFRVRIAKQRDRASREAARFPRYYTSRARSLGLLRDRLDPSLDYAWSYQIC